MAWGWPNGGEFSVADHRGREEEGEADHDNCYKRFTATGGENQDYRYGEDREQTPHPGERKPLFATENENETEQIKCQRNDPEQWHGGEIGRDESGHTEHQAARDERQQEPASPQSPQRLATGQISAEGRRNRFDRPVVDRISRANDRN